MPTKTDSDAEKSNGPKKCGLSCGTQSPGPKYNLRPVVGYKDHCQSKWREPAYSIGKEKRGQRVPCVGPGPNKYYYKLPGIAGYTIPRAVFKDRKPCIPGPSYTLPGFWSPAFTIVGKPKDRCPAPSSGPYDPPKYPPGPSFPFGLKGKDKPCPFSPPIRDVGPLCLVKPCPPAFSIVGKAKIGTPCVGPGPNKYYPKLMDKAPEYSFGVKFHECVALPRTECDELC